VTIVAPVTQHQRPTRFLALGLAAALAFGGAACGSDDSSDPVEDGVAPTSSTITDSGDSGSSSDDPLAQAVERQLEAFNVVDSREEGDTVIAVMGEDATDEDVEGVCDLLSASGRPIVTEVDGEQTPCP